MSLNITDREFQSQVLDYPGLVLVDFWASWCPPCRMLAPELDKLAARFAGQLKVVKVNVERELAWARHFRVSGIPHLMFFRGGALVGEVIGFSPEPALAQKVHSLLKGAA